MGKIVVKRHGSKEAYDQRKVYASCYSAALNCHYSEIESEKLANYVMKKVNVWVKGKKNVSSVEIRKEIIKHLYPKDKDIVLMYKHHLDLC
jgi:transcriptional regulator NrdR family protein